MYGPEDSWWLWKPSFTFERLGSSCSSGEKCVMLTLRENSQGEGELERNSEHLRIIVSAHTGGGARPLREAL